MKAGMEACYRVVGTRTQVAKCKVAGLPEAMAAKE
jgi:hypothetical protein